MRLYVISVICSYVMFCIVSAGVYSRTFGIGFATVDVRYGSSTPLILDDISSNFQWYQPKVTEIRWYLLSSMPSC